MAKFDPKILSPKEKEKLLNNFFSAIADLKNFDEASRFFKDLLNEKETAMLARRLEIAKFLDQGFTFEAIYRKLRVGRSTIASVNRWLNYGRNGYKIVVGRLLEKEKRKREEKSLKINRMMNPFDYKYKYPHAQLRDFARNATRIIKRKIKERKLKRKS